MKNKKGWIKILEAFIAIVMLLSMLTFVVNHERNESKEVSNVILTQSAFLSKVQENETLRNEILSSDISLGDIEINDTGFPSLLKDYIETGFSGRLECYAKICSATSECSLRNYPKKEIFSKSVIISSNFQEFNPKKLSLFCYRL